MSTYTFKIHWVVLFRYLNKRKEKSCQCVSSDTKQSQLWFSGWYLTALWKMAYSPESGEGASWGYFHGSDKKWWQPELRQWGQKWLDSGDIFKVRSDRIWWPSSSDRRMKNYKDSTFSGLKWNSSFPITCSIPGNRYKFWGKMSSIWIFFSFSDLQSSSSRQLRRCVESHERD